MGKLDSPQRKTLQLPVRIRSGFQRGSNFILIFGRDCVRREPGELPRHNLRSNYPGQHPVRASQNRRRPLKLQSLPNRFHRIRLQLLARFDYGCGHSRGASLCARSAIACGYRSPRGKTRERRSPAYQSHKPISYFGNYPVRAISNYSLPGVFASTWTRSPTRS